jgi:hypothetical protein
MQFYTLRMHLAVRQQSLQPSSRYSDVDESINDAPGQQLFYFIDRMIGNALKHIAQVGLRVNIVELRSADTRLAMI